MIQKFTMHADDTSLLFETLNLDRFIPISKCEFKKVLRWLFCNRLTLKTQTVYCHKTFTIKIENVFKSLITVMQQASDKHYGWLGN